MNVQLDWQVADENGEWETISTVERHPRFVVRWWVWSTLLAVLAISVTGGRLALRYLYNRALDRAVSQIQDVVNLETQALERGDVHLFLAQQDETLPAWRVRQARYVRTRCPQPDTSALDPFLAQDIMPQGCPSVPPTEVQSVDMRGDIAWVEVLSRREPVRQVRFYRQTELGWRHTAPHVAFWQDSVERTYGPVTVRCYERDLAHIEPLVEHISAVFDDLCAMLDCPPDATLDVDLSLTDRPPHLSGHRLTLASPWLSGIPVEGSWDAAYLDELTYWVAYETMSQLVRATNAGDPSWLERAILGEYAALYTHGHITQDPILEHIVEQYGTDLPETLRSAISTRVPSAGQ